MYFQTSCKFMSLYSRPTTDLRWPLMSPFHSVIVCIAKIRLVCTSKLAPSNYFWRSSLWNLWSLISKGHYSKVDAASDTPSWPQTGSLNWFRWWNWGSPARWMSPKLLWSAGFTSMDHQWHHSQGTQIISISSREYVSYPILLVYSPLQTIHRPMGRYNDTSGTWQPCCVATRMIISRTCMRTFLHSRSPKPASYTFLQKVFHLIWCSIGRCWTFHFNIKCLSEKCLPSSNNRLDF